MRKVLSVFIVIVCFSVNVWAEPANKLTPEALTALQLPDVQLTSVKYLQDSSRNGTQANPHVQVEGIIGKAIRFEVLLPDDWNGRFAMGGGGGLVGSVQNGIWKSLNKGYATAGTDTGHQASGTDGSWAQDDMEALVNFGHVAVHRTAEVSKAIIRAYYGMNPKYSYFVGCSRGGGQAMMESQRYPKDFDGIVAGAPAFDWTGFAAMGVNSNQVLYPNPDDMTKTVLTQEDLDALYIEIMIQADAQDGLKDGIIDDPLAVEFELEVVPNLTDEQRKALKTLYSGPSNSRGQIYTGFPIGAERGPSGLFNWQVGPIPDLVNLGHAFSTNIFKYFVFQDPDWDYSTYDFENWENDTRFAGSVLNATDPNLDAFKERNGKLILWHGWSDAALPAQATIEYYKEVLKHDPQAMDYARLFMVPGCYHCGGGPGVSGVDWLDVIVDWVEKNTAPERLVATKGKSKDNPARTRPLYPYPDRARYDGEGDPNDESNFILLKP